MKVGKGEIFLISELEMPIENCPQAVLTSAWYARLLSTFSQCCDTRVDFELSVILVEKKRIRELNKTYRKLARVTDVLSFAYDDGEKNKSGEIYICLAQAFGQRSRFHTTKSQEVARLFFHGTLHILGYDHQTSAQRKMMQSREVCLMRFSKDKNVW